MRDWSLQLIIVQSVFAELMISPASASVASNTDDRGRRLVFQMIVDGEVWDTQQKDDITQRSNIVRSTEMYINSFHHAIYARERLKLMIFVLNLTDWDVGTTFFVNERSILSINANITNHNSDIRHSCTSLLDLTHSSITPTALVQVHKVSTNDGTKSATAKAPLIQHSVSSQLKTAASFFDCSEDATTTQAR